MKNISFQLTEEQIRNRTKTVTRRLGWRKLKAGDLLQACVKCMGLKRGESPEKLARIRVVSVTREQLDTITADDCAREGFPDLKPMGFVEMFCRHMNVPETVEVTRIEFEYCD